ncbi:MAG: outer membrane receptor protein involved in Fe transport [Bacteriovoracaceae bacterium]|jgi:outer membrane receptor protein involved in Fe transport
MGNFKTLFLLLILLSVDCYAGKVDFYIFQGSLPADSVKISVEGESYTTNAEGTLSLNLEGLEHKATIHAGNGEKTVVNFKTLKVYPTTISYTILKKKNEGPVVLQEKAELNKNIIADSLFSGDVKVGSKKISGVKIFIHGTGVEGRSDDSGEFKLKVPSGTFSVSFMHPEFSTTTMEEVTFGKKKPIIESILLKPSGMQLEDFVIISPNMKSSINALLEVRRGHQTVADLIGSEQISKSGDSDAGSSLKRVTGLSLVDGKFVYVRGLGERYSNTLLNSSTLPSPDPSRRVVPLDLFPASVIENMVVQKGYTPDMPGEFGGGVISIKTKTIPAKQYTKFSLSQSLNSTSGLKSYEGTSNDWTGKTGSRRDLPRSIQKLLDKDINISGLDPEERKSLAASLSKNYETTSVDNYDKAIIPNFSLSTGGNKRFEKFKLGYNIASLFSNKWDQEEEEKTSYNATDGVLTEDSSALVTKHNNRVKLGALVGLGLKYKRNTFRYNGSILRNTENSVVETKGVDSEQEDYLKTQLNWKERQLETHQISGNHIIRSLNKAEFDWGINQSNATLLAPDNKMYTQKKVDGEYQVEKENGSASNNISWKEMEDKMENLRLDYTQPINHNTLKNLKLKLGYNNMHRKREYLSKTFYYKFGENKGQESTDVFNDEDAELFQQANETDNYGATQKVSAYYSNLNFDIGKLNINSGVRFEKSIQEVNSFKLFNQGKTISTLETEDYLPVISLNYKISSKMQIRSSISETVSRPDLREISKTAWNDDDQGATFAGNPGLKSAEIQNFDLRWEWFFNRGEILSLGYFEKRFNRPIEEIFGSLSDDGRIVGTTENRYTFINIDQAINRGLEFEFRKKLSTDFTFGGNYSIIESNVTIAAENAGQLTSLERPLQGQSPYLINLQLDYENKRWKNNFSFLYNVMGERITGVGADGRPDELQSEISNLDFVYSQKFNKNWKVKFKVKNILDPEVQRTQGNKVTRSYRKGQDISVGLNGVF